MGKLLFMINKLTFWQVVKLLWDCDQWEHDSTNPFFDDVLMTKDGAMWFYAETPMNFRSNDRNHSFYTATEWSIVIIIILSKRLYKKVKAREIA